jgi:hypothetical protein
MRQMRRKPPLKSLHHNCGGEHTASYHGCPIFVQAAEARKKNPTDLSTPMYTTTQTQATTGTNITYAQATAKSHTITSNKKNELVQILNNAISKINESSDFKQSILMAISALIALVNHE